MTDRIYCLDVGDAYVFKQYFDHTDLFDKLSEYYDGENYRFEVPPDEFEEVRASLEEYGYDPVVVDDLEAHCVVKEQYTPHAEILKRSVIHWSRDGYCSVNAESVCTGSFTVRSTLELYMPPDGYTTVTIRTELAEKLARIMALHDCSSYAEAIEYAADETLVQDDEITIRELVQLLADRLDELDDSKLP